MNVTKADAAPRTDGWFPHAAKWGEVVVGTVIASEDPQRSRERWEIIATSHGTGVQYGYTLWMRAREQTKGDEVTIAPRVKTNSVTVLTQDPTDTRTGDPTEPTDSEAIMNLIEGLGAEIMASKDKRTGEIVCPDYIRSTHEGSNIPDGFRAHLALFHNIGATGKTLTELVTEHGRSHSHSRPEPSGPVPHRHVPEDLTQF